MNTLFLILALFKWNANDEADLYGYYIYKNNTNVIAFILKPSTNYVITFPERGNYSITAVNSNMVESVPSAPIFVENTKKIFVLTSTNLTHWTNTGISFNVTTEGDVKRFYKLEIQ